MKFAKLHPQMFVGLKAGIVDNEHYENMGKALWLFLWCVLRQTGQGEEGAVCRGEAITYEFIHKETGYALRNVRRWMGILVEEGYVRLEREQYGFRLWIANPRKFRVTTNGQSEALESGQKWPVGVAKSGQSDGIHPIENTSVSGKPLRNYLTKLPKTDNTTAAAKAAAVISALAQEKKLPPTRITPSLDEQKKVLRKRGFL